MCGDPTFWEISKAKLWNFSTVPLPASSCRSTCWEVVTCTSRFIEKGGTSLSEEHDSLISHLNSQYALYFIPRRPSSILTVFHSQTGDLTVNRGRISGQGNPKSLSHSMGVHCRMTMLPPPLSFTKSGVVVSMEKDVLWWFIGTCIHYQLEPLIWCCVSSSWGMHCAVEWVHYKALIWMAVLRAAGMLTGVTCTSKPNFTMRMMSWV